MIFVDTGAWFALAVPTDSDHQSAKEFFGANREPLVTTDFVVDELLTLFRVRGQVRRAEIWLGDVYRSGAFDLVRVTPADFERALGIYSQFADKLWSFTDCTSFAVMERLAVTQAVAFDQHFRQYGVFQVLP